MKTTLFLAATLICTACSAPKPKNLKDVAEATEVSFNLDEQQKKLVDGSNDFGLRLFQAMAKAHPDSSMAFSPMGVVYSLNMLNNGADGQTLTEISKALGYAEADLPRVNELCQTFIIGQRKVLRTQVNKNNDYMHTSNLLATIGEDAVKRSFRSVLAENYFAETLSAPSESSLQQQANQWINEQTEGQLKQIPLELPANTRACLVNSIVFKAGWAQQFYADYTRKAPFYREDGRKIDVWMMSGYDDENVFRGRHDKRFTALRLPYMGQFYITLLLPAKGQTLDSLRKQLNADMIREINRGWIKFDKFYIRIPRISQTTTLALKPLLQDVGIKQAFAQNANLSKMSDEPLKVSDVVQQTQFSLDERGTSAISCTVTACTSLSALTNPREFYFTANRPFLYYISDGFCNVCFIGQYCGASTR